MRYFYSTLLLLYAISGLSQQAKVVNVDNGEVQIVGSLFYMVGSEPVSAAKYVKVVAGTPYFKEAWMKAKLATAGGTVFQNVLVRLDLVDNSLQYIGPKGNELVASIPVKSVILQDSVTGEEFKFIHSSFLLLPKDMEQGWYQVMATGKTSLYKKMRKSFNENKPYGSATTEQTIDTFGQYFIENGSVFTRVKKFKELPDMLKDKKDELNKYISNKKLTGKTDQEYVDVIDYYNKLLTNSNSVATLQ